MTQAIAAMAEAYPAVLFLQIEAEALPEISESFEVDEVPYTILLRVSWSTDLTRDRLYFKSDNVAHHLLHTVHLQGHALLGRVSGGQPKQVSDEIARHTSPAAALRSSEAIKGSRSFKQIRY